MNRKRQVLLLVPALLMLMLPLSAAANKATSYTYTLDQKHRLVRTQDAYLPDKTITTLGLNKPADLFITKAGLLYIADAQNKRVLVYNTLTGEVEQELAHPGFSSPTGLYVTREEALYVADPGARAVFRFDRDFNLTKEYTKPDSPVFADIRYEPMKVAVDAGGNLYIVGEGVYHGVIQLGQGGEFLGYFAVNQTRLTFSQALQRLIFTRDQLQNLVDSVPITFSNVFVDAAGITYTTTMSVRYDALKKHRTDGANMFIDRVFSTDALSDIWVDDRGIIYASDQSGYILIYSPAGEMIFNFGSFVSNLDVAGLFSRLPALAVDGEGTIWALDSEKGYIQSFKPTDYAKTVYDAMGLYEQGRYQESLIQWSQVLRLNQMSVLAHNGIAKAHFHNEDYERAIGHFQVAGNRAMYSEAFWELRNTFLQRWLPPVVVALAALAVLRFFLKRFYRKRGLASPGARLFRLMGRLPVVKDVVLAVVTPRHPVDAFYEVRRKRAGSVAGATILYALYFLIFMLYQTSKGFIYQFVAVEDMDITALVAGYFLLIGLFVLCNYLVTSINDGDGTLAQCYMIPAYSLAPLMGAFLLILGLSYMLTYSESFILSIILLSGTVWTLVTLFLALQNVHDYSVKETVRCIVLTLVFMIIAVIIVLIVLIMGEQLLDFLRTLYEEVLRNVYA
ncbi:MAG: DUF1282 family protein [Clostridiales bacterium]|nr:DUF1282 family protein [Clostridiales bacterium]